MARNQDNEANVEAKENKAQTGGYEYALKARSWSPENFSTVPLQQQRGNRLVLVGQCITVRSMSKSTKQNPWPVFSLVTFDFSSYNGQVHASLGVRQREAGGKGVTQGATQKGVANEAERAYHDEQLRVHTEHRLRNKDSRGIAISSESNAIYHTDLYITPKFSDYSSIKNKVGFFPINIDDEINRKEKRCEIN
ncbi:hypothetical protein EAG_05410 [Camponotus floridanus]|uniref:Uncharacterized protein n=1 Tax=Camponotus floridanus TaxID=104421 RepID=E2A5Z2_CAMFO|nr:hypothetical protein EAG_05410 [Camponotus floridanus]